MNEDVDLGTRFRSAIGGRLMLPRSEPWPFPGQEPTWSVVDGQTGEEFWPTADEVEMDRLRRRITELELGPDPVGATPRVRLERAQRLIRQAMRDLPPGT